MKFDQNISNLNLLYWNYYMYYQNYSLYMKKVFILYYLKREVSKQRMFWKPFLKTEWAFLVKNLDRIWCPLLSFHFSPFTWVESLNCNDNKTAKKGQSNFALNESILKKVWVWCRAIKFYSFCYLCISLDKREIQVLI